MITSVILTETILLIHDAGILTSRQVDEVSAAIAAPSRQALELRPNGSETKNSYLDSAFISKKLNAHTITREDLFPS